VRQATATFFIFIPHDHALQQLWISPTMSAVLSWVSKLSGSLVAATSRARTPLSFLSCWPVGRSSFGQQTRGSKYLSRSAKKRLVLTTKRARKGFYKGKGSTKEGYLTSKGKFVVDPLRRLELVVPDLTDFKVRT
jgi:hypothetical protein